MAHLGLGSYCMFSHKIFVHFFGHAVLASSKCLRCAAAFDKFHMKEMSLQSNLCKTTTLGTTQKWSSWTGCHLIKHLYKTTTNLIWLFLTGS